MKMKILISVRELLEQCKFDHLLPPLAHLQFFSFLSYYRFLLLLFNYSVLRLDHSYLLVKKEIVLHIDFSNKGINAFIFDSPEVIWPLNMQ